MAKYRYADTPIIDGRYLGTFRLPVLSRGLRTLDLLDGVKTFDHVLVQGERLDQLSARYFNESRYWWVIALVNNISYPFASGGVTPGRILKIPTSVQDVLDKIYK